MNLLMLGELYRLAIHKKYYANQLTPPDGSVLSVRSVLDLPNELIWEIITAAVIIRVNTHKNLFKMQFNTGGFL